MKYQFPQINHIDDVLPHLDDDNFLVIKKEGHTVINYILPDNTTFPPVKTEGDAIRRECRGIIFDEDGNITRRPFHKFFNCGEREETLLDNIDWEKPHVILDKVDGSLISPFELVDGTIIWGSKLGKTDFVAPVENYVAQNSKYTNFAHRAFASGTTPIFEWVSPQQRIVLGYPEDQLILTAIRGTVSGWYMPYESMVEVAKKNDIPYVKAYEVSSIGSHEVINFIENLQKKEGIEGVVIRFDSGHCVKAKCEWYVRIHKNKELVSSEKNLVELIVNQQLDDVIPFLMEEDKNKVLKYQDEFRDNFMSVGIETLNQLERAQNMTRKDFALSSQDMNSLQRAIIFKLFDEKIENELFMGTLMNVIKKHCTSNQMFAKLKGWLLKDINYE